MEPWALLGLCLCLLEAVHFCLCSPVGDARLEACPRILLGVSIQASLLPLLQPITRNLVAEAMQASHLPALQARGPRPAEGSGESPSSASWHTLYQARQSLMSLRSSWRDGQSCHSSGAPPATWAGKRCPHSGAHAWTSVMSCVCCASPSGRGPCLLPVVTFTEGPEAPADPSAPYRGPARPACSLAPPPAAPQTFHPAPQLTLLGSEQEERVGARKEGSATGVLGKSACRVLVTGPSASTARGRGEDSPSRPPGGGRLQ